MKVIIDRFIRSSVQGDIFDKALECLLSLRQSAVSEDEAPFFNKFLQQIKENYSSGQHSEFFKLIVKKQITLISTKESEMSSIVTPQEAEDFLKKDAKKRTEEAPKKVEKKEKDDFDLLE